MVKPIRLHINIDHVATLRNQREVSYPDPLIAGRLCMEAGADGLTVHLREDRRHIRDRDVERLCAERPGLINLEMAATSEMQEIARRLRPDVVTLVPEKRQEKTTEGGLDVLAGQSRVEQIAKTCTDAGIKLSLFIEASSEQVRAAKKVGAKQVEFHTGHYCDVTPEARAPLLDRIASCCRLARELGLEVAAGHGLNVENVAPVAAIPELEELNIGHSVICDAVLVGMSAAVRNLRAAVDRAREL